MKLFAEDELEVKNENNAKSEYSDYIDPLRELMKESKDACDMLPLYPLDAIEEFLKYLVYYKDVSGVKARLFSEKYFDLGLGYPIYRLLDLWCEDKYFAMLDELGALAETKR